MVAETVGVLCTRGRVEEKLLMAALAEAGFVACSLAPTPGPAPLGPSPSWPLADVSASGAAPAIVIDRLQDRALASAIQVLGLPGSARMVNAGVASSGYRLTVATTLARAGLPRPAAFAVHDEASGIEAASAAGFPATFLPFEPKSPGLTFWDQDTAEAVLEHREMLGNRPDTLGLIQQGDGRDWLRVTVAGGKAVGFEGNDALADERVFAIAATAATALHAELVGVLLVDSAHGPLIWDIDPAPDFRNATAIAAPSVAAAIVDRVRTLVSASGALVTS